MPWYYNEKTGLKIDVEAGSILEEVVQADPDFHSVEDLEHALTDMPAEATEEAMGEAQGLEGLSKAELIEMATLMGISVRPKDTIAQIRAKIMDFNEEE